MRRTLRRWDVAQQKGPVSRPFPILRRIAWSEPPPVTRHALRRQSILGFACFTRQAVDGRPSRAMTSARVELQLRRLSGGLAFVGDGFRLGVAADRDAARLERLGHDALEADMEQTVGEIRALHDNVVGQGEAALEGAAGDAAVEGRNLLAFRRADAAGDEEGVFLDR